MVEDTRGPAEPEFVLIDEWRVGLWGPAELSDVEAAAFRRRIDNALRGWAADVAQQLGVPSELELFVEQ